MKNQKGFTLVELVVVMAIIAVLVSLALLAINAARLQSRNTIRRTDAQEIKVGLESYFASKKKYPACTSVAVYPYSSGGTCVEFNGAAGMQVTYLASGIGKSDPSGSAGNFRMCYNSTGAGTYDLWMIGEPTAAPTTCPAAKPAASTAGFEDFSQG